MTKETFIKYLLEEKGFHKIGSPRNDLIYRRPKHPVALQFRFIDCEMLPTSCNEVFEVSFTNGISRISYRIDDPIDYSSIWEHEDCYEICITSRKGQQLITMPRNREGE